MQIPHLVASDIDGTLLDPMERVSARTARVARRIDESGTPFVLVTGRPPRWVPRVSEALGVHGIAVCSNGAVRYDTRTDTIIGASAIDVMLLHDVAHEIRTVLPGCWFATERCAPGPLNSQREVYAAEPGFLDTWPDSDITTAPLAEVVGHPAVKLLVLHPRMRSAEMAAAVQPVVGDQIQVTYSTGSGLLELSSPGVDKSSGLAEVARELGVERYRTIAFGDMPNDIAMVGWAGHGVAVANAHPEVLAAADEVTAANADDGVAQVLERWW